MPEFPHIRKTTDVVVNSDIRHGPNFDPEPNHVKDGEIK